MTHDIRISSETVSFARAVLEGLSQKQKTLPCRYLYDARGSELFEKITALPEYYPTRTETEILRSCAAEIAEGVAPGAVLVEFGSGSSRKTELMLQALPSLAAYVPIDVSASALAEAVERLKDNFPALRVHPIVGDFLSQLTLPTDLSGRPLLGFFPGSTIGNFEPAEAVKLLAGMRRQLGDGSHLVVGADLHKSQDILIPAYDDAAGVTAAFNKNILARINRELGGDFDLDGFAHQARFNPDRKRIEMHLASQTDQVVSLLGQQFRFRPGETIHTENSHKFTHQSLTALASEAGWTIDKVWSDPNQLFSVCRLVAA
jgi:dimethylhistidine N-methyltransferase